MCETEILLVVASRRLKSIYMADFKTQSEKDFYEFCRQQSWRVEKLPESDKEGVRTPDFRILTETGYEFIVEVTEFEPEPPIPKDKKFRVRGHTLGNPLRAKLHEKKGQVKSYADRFATLIVVSGGFDHFAELEPHSFDAALYGELSVAVTVPNDPSRNPIFAEEMHNAGRRFFGSTHNTSISAVAALDRRPQVLRIYHNKYAKIPLDPSRISINTVNVEHYSKPDGSSPGWDRV